MIRINILTFLHCEFDALCHHFNKAFMYMYVCYSSLNALSIGLRSFFSLCSRGSMSTGLIPYYVVCRLGQAYFIMHFEPKSQNAPFSFYKSKKFLGRGERAQQTLPSGEGMPHPLPPLTPIGAFVVSILALSALDPLPRARHPRSSTGRTWCRL